MSTLEPTGGGVGVAVGVGSAVGLETAVGAGVAAGVETLLPPHPTATRAAISRQASVRLAGNRIFSMGRGVINLRAAIVSG